MATEEILVDETNFSEEEKAQITKFASSIDLHDTQAIVEYGSGVQKKLADFSQETLAQVKTKNMGEVGELLTRVVSEVKSFDASTEKKGGLLGLFQKAGNRLRIMKTKFEDAETNITTICNALENHQVVLLKDVAKFDEMYEINLQSYKEITMYIIAGKNRLAEIRNGELKELQEKAAASGLPEDAQKAKDLNDQCDRFEKKLYDLNLSRTISEQTAPQIRLLQNADSQMAEKIQSVLVNTIPLWKNQMVIALGIQHNAEAIEAEARVTDATNELLRQNAENLRIGATQAAQANERGIVDLETLKETNEKLIGTLNEVMEIQRQGKEARQNAEIELGKMEDELKAKLLEMSQK